VQFRKLGNTDINTSAICLGTMTYGEQNSEEDAYRQLDFAVEHGINFLDTAEIYPVPPKAETCGRSEAILGAWLKKRNNRKSVILASKVAGPAPGFPWIRGGKNRLDRANIEEALDRSLERLQTDYLDLYQLHWPNRQTNFFGQLGYKPDKNLDEVPVYETLAVLKNLLNLGKIRHYGISNETPWGLMHYIRAAEKAGMPRPVSIQNPYCLLNRTFEIGNAEAVYQEHISLLAYSPLGFGVLSGKYLDNRLPVSSRRALYPGHFERYSSTTANTAVQKYASLGREAGIPSAQLAIAFVLSRPYLASAIIGATTLEQLKENIESVNVTLPATIMEKIDEIHAAHPNPAW
jgi:aryl-alcohol dehydrogenase-like predicted oxidoreductase